MSFLSSGNAAVDFSNAQSQIGAAQGTAQGYADLYHTVLEKNRGWVAHAKQLEDRLEFARADAGSASINTIARRLTIEAIVKMNTEGKMVSSLEADQMEKSFYQVARNQYPETAKLEELAEKFPSISKNI